MQKEVIRQSYIQTEGNHFVRNGEKIILRGWALGSWMNFEHFMMGLPGTHSMILEAFEQVYGKERAGEWLEQMLVNMVSEEDIRYLKHIGINSVRIPFGYHFLMDDRNPGVFLESGFEKLDRVVKLCQKYELFVILDLHSVPGGQNTDWHSDNITGQPLFWQYRCFQDQVVWLWEELASRYADNPWIVGYDIINEPGYGLTEEQINGFYERICAAVRKKDPHHIFFLEGIDFGRDFAPLRALADGQVAYTVHFYPFVLEEDVLSGQMDDERRMEIFTEIFERQLCETRRFGRPIWCGESGYEILEGQEDFYAMLLSHNIALCEERGISWNLWTYKDARRMGIVIPEQESEWMQLLYKISGKWGHEWEQKVSMEITKWIGAKYYQPLDDKMAYDLDFRIRSVMHRIGVEQILKPALAEIPWQRMKDFPKSFAFSVCEKREIIVDMVRRLVSADE